MSPTSAADPDSARMSPTAYHNVDGNASTLEEEMASPDLSAHDEASREKTLQSHDATAASYVTHHGRDTKIRDINPFGPDGRLSAASALHDFEPHPVKS
jgi:hypothetical protein